MMVFRRAMSTWDRWYLGHVLSQCSERKLIHCVHKFRLERFSLFDRTQEFQREPSHYSTPYHISLWGLPMAVIKRIVDRNRHFCLLFPKPRPTAKVDQSITGNSVVGYSAIRDETTSRKLGKLRTHWVGCVPNVMNDNIFIESIIKVQV